MAKVLVFGVLLAALMISASATVGFSNVSLVRADDGGSDSGSSSGGDSGSSSGGDSGNSGSSGGSSDSNSGGSNDNGHDGNTGSSSEEKTTDEKLGTLPNTGQGIDENTGLPKAEPRGLLPKSEEQSGGLPKCDGSFHDCVTKNGDTCKADQGGHECECADDMSDCPNHPSLTEQPTKTQTPDKSNTVKPWPHHCPTGFHWKHGACIKNIVINVHTHNHGSSDNSNSNSGSEISDDCYSQIKIAWIGKIQRGSNQAVDNIIDRCMGLA